MKRLRPPPPRGPRGGRTCFALLLIAAGFLPDVAPAVDKGGVYAKLFLAQWSATELFDDSGNRVSFGGHAKATFRTAFLETFYGLTTRFNPGIELRVDYSRFESNRTNSVGDMEYFKEWRTELTDARFQGEYYLSSFPKMLSVLAGWQVPLGYDEEKDPWIGTGSQAVFGGFRAKRFFESLKFDVELDAEVTTYLETTTRVEKGDYVVPVDLFMNFYPNITTWTIFSGLGYLYQENSWYLKGDLGLKYKITGTVIIEGIGSYWFAGRNTGAGITIGGGISYGFRDFPF